MLWSFSRKKKFACQFRFVYYDLIILKNFEAKTTPTQYFHSTFLGARLPNASIRILVQLEPGTSWVATLPDGALNINVKSNLWEVHEKQITGKSYTDRNTGNPFNIQIPARGDSKINEFFDILHLKNIHILFRTLPL